MVRIGIVLFGLVLLVACKAKKKSGGEEGFSYEDFSGRFGNSSLPYQISDTALLRNKDTALIRSTAFAAFVSDSVRTRLFGKNAKVRYTPLQQIKISSQTSFYVVKAVSGSKRAALLMAFDKGQYSAVFPLLLPDSDPATTQWSVIDKGLGITKSIARKGDPAEGRDVFQYDARSRQFSLVLTNPLDGGPGELINPIDTFPRKHKFSGDYGKDKKNIVSIRDGRYPNQLMVFVHLDKDDGACTGELKGTLLLTSSTAGIYREGGDPCMMSFRFSGNSVVIKEDQGCGAHRGLDCSFDGTYARKKEAKPKPPKKGSTGK